MNRQSSVMMQTKHMSPRQQLMILLGRGVYVWVSVGLSCLFFVVTGIQYWITSYLVVDLRTFSVLFLLIYIVCVNFVVVFERRR
jgi:hypothetical protein